MTHDNLAVVILAAGLGTRMKSSLPKALHPVGGRPMIGHLLATLQALSPARVVAVIGDEMDAVRRAVHPHSAVEQGPRLGTAHAVKAARDELADHQGDVLVVYGDTPFLTVDTLQAMLRTRREAPHPAVVVLGFRPPDPTGYGRLVLGADGGLEAIVEHRDAGDNERAIGLCNSGVMAIDGSRLFGLLDRVGNDNAKGEYYLTDIIGLARDDGLPCAAVEGAEAELLGIDSRADLARAEGIFQDRMRASAMGEGVTLMAPETVFFSADTRLGRDVTVGPNVVFGPGVTVGDNVLIRPFSHLEGATVGDGAQVGPFARLRPGAHVAADAHIGNFVEIKNATVEDGAKVNHLTYIGDARVGARANVGAGTITCNYDGFFKSHTDIGAGAFIGSNTSLVAPVSVGDGAIIGAGSVLTRDAPADSLALTRGPRTERAGWAAAFRRRRSKEKAAAQSGGSKSGGSASSGKNKE